MEGTIEKLTEIVNQQLEECIKEKTIPSKEVLDIVNQISNLKYILKIHTN